MKRLLVIEDHPWVLQALMRVLRPSGAHIESATTLRSARRRVLDDDPYDVVICEHHLSDGTGFEFLTWLRWQQHIPVPFLLIARNPDLQYHSLEDFSILSPPIEPQRLLASLNALVARTGGLIACQIPFAGEREPLQ